MPRKGLVLIALASTLLAPACEKRSATRGPADPCADFEVEVEKYWSASIKAQVLEHGGELETEQRRGVTNKMDRISEDWVMMRTSVCKDHFVRGMISKDEYAARVQCFDDRLASQRKLAEALAGADSNDEVAAVDSSLDALLAEPASCQPRE